MALTDKQYKELSVKEFTQAAEKYEGNHAGVYELCKEDYPDILAEIEKEPFETLLDAGCGPAPMISLLSEKYPDKRYTGIDLTPKMIEVARRKNIPNATFVVGDCEELPFPDEAFDVIICSMSAHHYPHVDRFYANAYPTLKPGGRLILRDMTAKAAALRWFATHIEMPLANRTGHGDVTMLRLEDVKAGMEKAGFAVTCCEQRKKLRLHAVGKKA